MQARQGWTFYLAIALTIGFIAVWFVTRDGGPTNSASDVPYSTLLHRAEKGELIKVDFKTDRIVAETLDGQVLHAARLPDVDDQRLVDALVGGHAEVSGTPSGGSWGPILIFFALPILFTLLFILWIGRRMRQHPRGTSGLGIGKVNARVTSEAKRSPVTFADVAGVDEARAELVEIVDFLKHPARYQALGARIPKGVLLVGPPGTGKTLLARAVAGEAAVPFFSISGSGFVELFVGVGAARIRNLFQEAVRQAPCIVFIDELDAVGKRRGPSALAGNDEREQTLDQLLAEMDGFEPNTGVVLMAATNRPDVLDPALLRAGRFDRQVLVDRPDQAGRVAILGVHARRIKLARDVDLERVARRVPGMVGAELANLVNEAALAAARRNGSEVTADDFEEAMDRLQLGLAKRDRVMTDAEKRRVACHESGHALAALLVDHADPLHRVSIMPRSIGALGVTLQLPTHDRYLLTEPELHDRMTVLLAGRAAEASMFADVSTGAEDDLAKATELARLMVTRYGMSPELGCVSLGRRAAQSSFLDELATARDYSEQTGREIDQTVRGLVDAALARARALLEPRRATLAALTEALIDRETLNREDIDAILAAERERAAA